MNTKAKAKEKTKEKEKFICPECKQQVNINDTEMTYDIYGIPFRKLCRECASKIMDEFGYDGRDYRLDCSENIW